MTSKYGVPKNLPSGKRNPEYARRQYAARRDKVRSYSAQWRAANPDKIRGYGEKYYSKNRELVLSKGREYARKHRLEHREQHLITMRKFHLKRGYGMTLEEYQERLNRQKNRCAICGKKHVEAPRKRLTVDHDHKTGKVRALLCGNCNALLGHAEDNIDTIRKAAKYLEFHKN